MMKPFLTEERAWKRIADRCLAASRTKEAMFGLGRWIFGLCGTVARLYEKREVSQAIRQRMMHRIEAYGKTHPERYGLAEQFLWPLTQIGMDQRAAWCMRQVTMLARRRKQARALAHRRKQPRPTVRR